MKSRVPEQPIGQMSSKSQRVIVKVRVEDLAQIEALVRSLDKHDQAADRLRSQIEEILADQVYGFEEVMQMQPGVSARH